MADFNQDETRGRNRDYYLRLVKDFKSSYPHPEIKERNGFTIIDESSLASGSKSRFAEPLIASIKEDKIVYVQAKYGYASISLIHLAKQYNKKLVLFMPAAKTLSPYQEYCISQGAVPIFLRIAGFPAMISAAKRWSAQNNAYFLPLGLRDELVTAMIVRTCQEIALDQLFEPERIWCSVSTGVLARGIQIAWPKTIVTGVLVARNLHPGEAGNLEGISYNKPIWTRAKSEPDMPDSCPELDGKAMEYMVRYGKPGDWMWNVAGDVPKYDPVMGITSSRNWGDYSDLTKTI